MTAEAKLWNKLREHINDVGKLMHDNGLKLDSHNRVKTKVESLSFNVPITALMKSGKSTLVDAILGDEILPWGDLPETTRVVRVIHKPELEIPHLYYQGKLQAKGAPEICALLKNFNTAGRDLPATVMDEEFIVHAPIVALRGTPFSDVQFHILDTPGPNEARADALKKQVDIILKSADVILYLLDYTSLGKDDEQKFFENLFSLKKEVLVACCQRIFFVVTKIDMHSERAPPLADIPKTVVNLLRKLCPPESRDKLVISESQVLLVNAKEALLARQIAGSFPSESVQKEYAKIVFGKRPPTPLLPALQQAVEQSLVESKMMEFEEKVLSFLRLNSWPIFLDSVIHLLLPCLAELKNYIVTTISALTLDREQLALRTKTLVDSVHRITNKFKAAEQETEKTKNNMIEQIQNEFGTVSKKIRATIERACDEDDSGIHKGGGLTSVMRSLAIESAKGKSQETVAEHVRRMNEIMARLVQDEFANARRELEEIAADRLRSLCIALKELVHPLVQQVEETVKQNIPLHLPFTDFHLELSPPTERDLHATVSNFGDLIKLEQETVVIQVEKKTSCPEIWGKWETKKTKVTSYSFNKEDMIKKWVSEADKLAAKFTHTATELTKLQFDTTAREAQQELRRYGQLLVDAAESALKTHNQGEAATKERIEHLSAQANLICKIICQIVDMKAMIAQGYQGNAALQKPGAAAPQKEETLAALVEAVRKVRSNSKSVVENSVISLSTDRIDLTFKNNVADFKETNVWHDSDEDIEINIERRTQILSRKLRDKDL